MKIDGKQIADTIFRQLKKRVEKLKEKNIIPHLTVVLTSNDPSSVSYVNQKKIKGKSIGAKITVKHVPQSISQSKLLAAIEQLNNKANVHGIIIQRPLPKAIDKNKISLAIEPKKDVDGFNPKSKLQPPLALAVLRILEEIYMYTPRVQPQLIEWLKSKKIVVIGKGETGGKPVIYMLKKMNIKLSIIDSKTKNPQNLTKKADIIISCIGKPDVIKPEMIKKGVILVGVGLYKGGDGKMHGDYEEEKIKNIASFYTPTPGGVGPVNVAMLLENLVKATENSQKK